MARNIRVRRQRESQSILGSGLKSAAVLSIAAAGGWIAYSRMAINHNVILPEALPVVRREFESPIAGRISYYQNEEVSGRPLVFIHSINAAASAYEMRPIFLHFMGTRPVYALELPGYGFSERLDRNYTPELFVEAIIDFLSTQIREPADVMALSLSSEFAARAALERPDLFNSLVLVSPTGFALRSEVKASQNASRSGMSDFLHPLFAFPLWSRPFFDLLTTRASIEAFLRQSFVGAVPPDLIDYAYATAHQAGAEHVPLYFISGKLFSPDIRKAVYERLQTRTLVLYDRDNYTSFELLPETLAKNEALQAVRLVPSLGLPQYERPEDTAEVLQTFWK